LLISAVLLEKAFGVSYALSFYTLNRFFETKILEIRLKSKTG